MVVAEIVSFIIYWLFFALAIYITAAIFGSKKGFGKALIMALLLEIIHFVITWFLSAVLGSWAEWVILILMFIILVIAFMKTYGFGTGKAIIAAIVCIILIWIFMWVAGQLMQLLAPLLSGLP